ncbi:OmpA family protein [Desulfobacter latus]|uniref:OmpA family protein n=1 Tax=Desulfobacter latus TaxID=2292 RepID=A0A850T0Y3_9BACT|nr:OmpA family protein [Desulfobacter latus]NWH05990.1 OmpA family protein [Desulfobacter latus]
MKKIYFALMGLAVSVLCWVAVVPPALASEGCRYAKQLYDEAMNHTDNPEKIRLLEKSADLCPDFEIYFNLGQALEKEKKYEEARMAYKEAQLTTEDGRLQANALIMIGGSYEAQKAMHLAIRHYRQAQMLHENPKVDAHLQKLVLSLAGEYVPQVEIARALTESTKGFSVSPRIDLYINFDLGSHDLSSHGAQQQAGALGRALMNERLKGSHIYIVGHTDSQGDASYNMSLSMKRAESVKRFLIRQFPSLTSHLSLSIQGKGETRLLISPETTARHYAANRRVEVVVQ